MIRFNNRTLTNQDVYNIADYIVKTSFDDLPEKVISRSKVCILDNLGCMLGGYRTKTGKIVANLARETGGGKQESTVIGSGDKVSCVCAAFANSMMANALDFDDTYAAGSPPIIHPASTTVPPAIAVGERVKATGKDVITSVVLGYEVSIRIGAAIFPSPERMSYVMGLSTFQTFGAVTAASKLLSLSREQVLNALGIAGATAPVSSVMKTTLNPMGASMVKNNYGWASQNGVTAALLAKMGFNGPKDILDGNRGFWIMAGSDRCNFDKLVEKLGEKYELMNVGFKPYPSCRLTHQAIDATIRLVRELRANGLQLEEIEEIIVRSISTLTEPPFTNYKPKNMEDSQLSLPFSIAAAIYGGKPGPDWFAEKNLPRILELARKVKIEVDPEAESHPHLLTKTKVAIIAGGRQFTAHTDTTRGDPENPMTKDELREKFRGLASEVIEQKKAEIVVNIVDKLEKMDDITKLTDALHCSPIHSYH